MPQNAFSTARSRLQEFQQNDQFMADHIDAMDCFDCEELLQLGIEALHWIKFIATAIDRGIVTFNGITTADLQSELAQLFVGWLKRAELAKLLIDRCEKLGFQVENSSKFYDCVEDANDWLESYDLYQRSCPVGDD